MATSAVSSVPSKLASAPIDSASPVPTTATVVTTTPTKNDQAAERIRNDRPVVHTSPIDSKSVKRESQSRSPERPAVSPITPHASAVPGGTMEQPPPLNISAPEDVKTTISPSVAPKPVKPPTTETSVSKETAKTGSPKAVFIPPPPSKPFSDEESTDAAALRAAISILQIQKEKSKRDIQTLKDIREAAARNPEKFMQDFAAGKLRHDAQMSDPLNATFEGGSDSEEEDEEEDDAKEDNAGADGKDSRAEAVDSNSIPKFPNAQNIFRCPPVNWAKYGIVGEPLDRMHDDQRRRPSPGQPAANYGQQPTSDYAIAAPYSPWKDALDIQHPMQTRRGSFKPG